MAGRHTCKDALVEVRGVQMMWSERSASAVLHSVEALDHGEVGLEDRGEFAAPFGLVV